MRQAKGAGNHSLGSIPDGKWESKRRDGKGRWGATRRGPSHSLFMCSIIILYFGGKTVQGNRQLCDEPALYFSWQ